MRISFRQIDVLHIKMASETLLVVTFLMVHSYGQGFLFNMVSKVSVLPRNPYVFIGENLTMECTVTDNMVENSTLYFRKRNGENISSDYWEMHGPDLGILNYPILSMADEGQYCCEVTKLGASTQVDCQYVRVERRPVNIEDFHCMVLDYDYKMTCNWSLGINYANLDPQDVNVYFEWNYAPTAGERNYRCPHNEKTSCSWNRGDASFSDHLMVFYVTARDDVANVHSTYQKTLNTSEIVKPFGLDLFQGRQLNSSCVELSWKQHQLHRQQLCRIQYKAQGEEQNKILMSDGRSPEAIEELCDLRPHTFYTFEADVKPQNGGFFSEKSTVQIMTGD